MVFQVNMKGDLYICQLFETLGKLYQTRISSTQKNRVILINSTSSCQSGVTSRTKQFRKRQMQWIIWVMAYSVEHTQRAYAVTMP